MARKITVVCDAPPTELHSKDEHEADGIARVGFNGQWRELDVCEIGADVVRDIMADLMSRGHTYQGKRAEMPKAQDSSKGSEARAARRRNRAVRTWAGEKGIAVSPSGQIPQPVIDAYELDNPEAASTAVPV